MLSLGGQVMQCDVKKAIQRVDCQLVKLIVEYSKNVSEPQARLHNIPQRNIIPKYIYLHLQAGFIFLDCSFLFM